MEMENYFFGELKPERRDTVYALVIYDIVENKKRTKLAKVMCGYGERVQKSAFEVHLSRSKYEKMKRELPHYCGTEDSIRIYKLTGQCEVLKWGKDIVTEEPEDVILI